MQKFNFFKNINLAVWVFCLVAFAINQSSAQNGITGTGEAVQLDYNRSTHKRIAQAFISNETGELGSITIRLRGERGTAQGGKLALDLFEISNQGQPIYKGTSEYKGYFWDATKEGKENIFNFGPGIEIKTGMAYYFVVRSNNFFQIVGSNNSNQNINGQPSSGGFFINRPYNRIEDVNTADDISAAQPLPNAFNMYFTFNLK